jgi:hypothetical protein
MQPNDASSSHPNYPQHALRIMPTCGGLRARPSHLHNWPGNPPLHPDSLHAPPQKTLSLPPAVLFFGNKLTPQTQLGTAIALVGTWLYTEASKKKPAPKAA